MISRAHIKAAVKTASDLVVPPLAMAIMAAAFLGFFYLLTKFPDMVVTVAFLLAIAVLLAVAAIAVLVWVYEFVMVDVPIRFKSNLRKYQNDDQ